MLQFTLMFLGTFFHASSAFSFSSQGILRERGLSTALSIWGFLLARVKKNSLHTSCLYSDNGGGLHFTCNKQRLMINVSHVIPKVTVENRSYLPGGAGSGVWIRGSMIAREKKYGRVRLGTNALNINMADVLSIVVIENLSWSSSVNRLLLLFILTLVNLDLLWRESQTSWMESKRLVEESLTAVSTCSHLTANLLKVFIVRPRYYDF